MWHLKFDYDKFVNIAKIKAYLGHTISLALRQLNALIRREKCKRANLKTGVSRKQSTPKFLKNKHFLPPDTHTYVFVLGGKKCLFYGNFGVLCFLETPASRFCLITDELDPMRHHIFMKSVESKF